jgi:hypothetical protein
VPPAINLVVTCTKRKTRTPLPGLQLRSVAGKTPAVRAAKWLRRLSSCRGETVPVAGLYAGDHWSVVRAGWEGPAPGEPRTLAQLARSAPRSSLLVVASDVYLRAMAKDLQEALGALARPEQLAVLSAGAAGAGPLAKFLLRGRLSVAGWDGARPERLQVRFRHGRRPRQLAAECAYAAEDALLELLFEQPEEQHARWRRLPPDDPRTLPRIGRELTGTSAVAQVHLQVLRRVLFQAEAVGVDRFGLYDLHREVRAVRRALEDRARPPDQPPRRPTAWELVGAAVTAAQEGRNVPNLEGLLAAYGKLTAGLAGSAPSAEARLADQVYRLSASLCVDGCRACLHRGSALMPDAQASAAVSRDLLHRYREFVLGPLTISVSQDLPAEAVAQTILTEQGTCRLLVAPGRYDALAAELSRRGFARGAFDPLLRAVVCARSAGRKV